MAFVQQRFQIRIQFVDKGANSVERSYPMTALTYETASDEAEDVIAAFQAVTLCAIRSYAVEEVYLDNAFAIPSGAGAEVENQALNSFVPVGDPMKRVTLSLPAPVPEIMQGPSGAPYNKVDGTATQFVTWWGLFADDSILTLSDGSELASFIEGKRIHRRSNRG